MTDPTDGARVILLPYGNTVHFDELARACRQFSAAAASMRLPPVLGCSGEHAPAQSDRDQFS